MICIAAIFIENSSKFQSSKQMMVADFVFFFYHFNVDASFADAARELLNFLDSEDHGVTMYVT